MDTATQAKWNRAARSYDLMSARGPEQRWRPAKERLFSYMRPDARILFVALGTGLDIACFPRGRHIVGIDISPAMLARAEPRARAYEGNLVTRLQDVTHLDFPDGEFDQVFTSGTFCSVPDPVKGLKELRRVLKPGGELYMFEHTGSCWFPFNVMMNALTPLTRRLGPDMNRHTAHNVESAGFQLRAIENVFLDVVKMISAVNPIMERARGHSV